MGTSSARRPCPARWRTSSPRDSPLRDGPQHPLYMAPPCAHGPPGCPDGSPPGAAVPRPSALARAGTTARGAGPVPSDLECGADPCQGRLRRTVTPYHSTPAPSLRVAAPPQTAGSLSARPAPHAQDEAGSTPSHRGQAMAGSRTPGLGTPACRPATDQSRDHQADEARQATGPDTAPATPQVALLRTAPSP